MTKEEKIAVVESPGEPTIVEASFSMAGQPPGSGMNLSAKMERACVLAIETCLAEGITDPDIQKRKKAEARNLVLEHYGLPIRDVTENAPLPEGVEDIEVVMDLSELFTAEPVDVVATE